MAERMRSRAGGFTLIELLVVVALVGVLLSLVGPSFRSFFAKKRVDGVTSELATDLQYARSESVSRNALVQMTFGTNCYVIHLATATAASCTQTSKTITPSAAEIKTVQLEPGSNVTLTPQGGLTTILIDAVRATPGALSEIDVTSAVGGSWQLRAAMTLAGRVSTCSPNASMSGYVAC